MGGTSLEELLQATREHFDLAADGRDRAERLVLDTADRRLRAKGCELAFEPDGDPHAGLLLLRSAGRSAIRTEAPLRERYRAADLPSGPLAEHVAPLIDVRVLLPVVRLRVDERRWRVLDSEGKTVVRIALIAARAVPQDRRALALAPRIELRPVLGYDRQAERLAELLADLDMREAGESLTDEAVRAAGGEPSGIVTKVRLGFAADERAERATLAILGALADVVEANLPGTLDDLDPEFLHDLRVAVRRSRSVLRQMKGVLPPAGRDRARADLKWLQQVTGPVRDLDVQLLDWEGLIEGLPAELRADLAVTPSLLERRRAAAFSTMRRQLDGPRFRRSWAAWREFLAQEPLEPDGERPNADRPIGAVVGRRIRREYRRMVEMGEAIDDESPGEALHDLRKRGKELRYLLELFGHLWPPEAVKPLVTSLKGLQDVLGRHQDQEVQAGALRTVADDLVAAGEPGATALALGVVVERLHREQAEARAEFAERFAPFADAAQREIVRRTFRGPA